MLDQLLARVRQAGSSKHVNIVAYSGGVDSSLVAALVHRVFPENSIACLGVSAALPQDQLLLARNVASAIGIPLWEARTSEGNDPRYVENKGQSCYYCKTNLYTTLNQVAAHVKAQGSSPGVIPVMFNGTNADDKLDPTRLGLVAATEFQVVSPLEHISKASVRQISKDLGLPNWNYAASPCLRSRLAFGVSANPDHLARIEKAEGAVRSSLALACTDNLRVRFLANNRAAVELDAEKERALLPTQIHHVETICRDLGCLWIVGTTSTHGLLVGFDDVVVRSFKSGSVSGYTPSSSSGP